MKQMMNFWRSAEWRFSLGIFLLFRFGLWGWMILVRRLIPIEPSSNDIIHPYLGIPLEQNTLLEVWQRWDVLHYQWIAIHGYSATSLEPFGPLYPTLMRWGAYLTGNNTLLAGLVVSSLFCLAAIHAFLTLARMELGTQDHSQQALLYLVFFPTAFFLFAPYTESIYLLGAIMSIKSLRQQKWIAAGLWGMLAASVRLPAALLILPALYEAWMEWRRSNRRLAWTSPFLILLGAGLFPIYIWAVLKLPPWALFQSLDTGFQRSFSFPGLNLWYSIQNIFGGAFPLVNGPDLVIAILFIAGTVLVWKKLPVVYGIYTSAFMILYLSTTTAPYPLLSISRYVLVLFPVFLAMPALVKQRKIQMAILVILLTGLLFYSAQFAIWGWVG
jgi:Gpi18-like mannosyltransferase